MKIKQLATPTGRGVDWRVWTVLPALIALAVIICYANTIGFGTVFNDKLTLSFVNGPDANYAGNLLLETFIRPITQPWLRYSYIVDEANYGTNFGWYHLVNVFLHLSAAVAFFALTFRMAKIWKENGKLNCEPHHLAFAAGLLFACHPLAAEPVSYISGRYAVLAAANYLLALNCFIAGVNARGMWRALSWIAFFSFAWMAYGSSELGLALPLSCIALFLLICPHERRLSDWIFSHPFVSGISIAFAVTLPFSLISSGHAAAVSNWYGLSIAKPLAYYSTQCAAFASYYLRCVFVPLGLSVDPPFSHAQNFLNPFAIAGAVLLCGIAASVYVCRKSPAFQWSAVLVLFGFLAHAAIPQTELVSDSVFYLSLAGCCLTLAYVFVPRLNGQWKADMPKLTPVVLILMGLTISRNLNFANDTALSASTLKTNRDSAVGHLIAAENAFESGNYERAIDESDLVLAAEGNAPLPLLIKGTALSKQNKWQEADKYLNKAAELAQKHHLALQANAKFALAENYLRLGKMDDARKWLYTGLYDDPHSARACYLLGVVACDSKLYDQGILFLRKAAYLGYKDALPPLAEAYMSAGRFLEAYRCAKEAMKESETPASRLALAHAALALNIIPEAESVLSAAVKQQSDNPRALALTALLYRKKGDDVLAQSFTADAVKRDKDIFAKITMPAAAKQPEANPANNRQGAEKK